ASQSRTRVSSELPFGRRLIRRDPPRLDVRHKIVLALDGCTGGAAHDRELADVRERVGDGSLKEVLFRAVTQSRRGLPRTGEQRVEFGRGSEKALHVGVPRLDGRVVPRLLAFGDRRRPVHQIANVREDLSGAAATGYQGVTTEVRWRVAEHFGRP